MSGMPRWLLGTSSYGGFRPWMGVPVRTSLGVPKWFTLPHETAPALFPHATFRSKAPEDQHPELYRRSLNPHRVEGVLDDLTLKYPGQRLILLCWENVHKDGDAACHRRWLAPWMLDHYGIDLPEAPPREPLPDLPPEPDPEPTLF